jgi:hypothetical protein
MTPVVRGVQPALEIAGGWLARGFPQVAPGSWLPLLTLVVAGVTLAIAVGFVRRVTGSRVAAVASAVAFAGAATSGVTGSAALTLVLPILGLVAFWRQVLAVPGAVIVTAALYLTTGLPAPAWFFTGLGLAAVVLWLQRRHVNGNAAGSAAIVLALIIAGARGPTLSAEAPPSRTPMGHDQLTATSFRSLLALLPPHSALVRDDAATAVLFRANQPSLDRARVDLTMIQNDSDAVRGALSSGRRVFALPYAQRDLQLRGFTLADSLMAVDRGIAEIKVSKSCAQPTTEWQWTPALDGASALSLVAGSPDDRGPVTIYLGGASAMAPTPVDWPERTRRGFVYGLFARPDRIDSPDLAAVLAEDAVPPTIPTTSDAHITRLVLWRLPDAALSLRVDLTSPVDHAVVRLDPGAEGRVVVCPVQPFETSKAIQ